jgi:dipeptidyl aminopeptidase/acylaminoacyl peptidase
VSKLSGRARSHSIVLTGWSYGGYLTLLALGRFPDLWAGGMAGYAIADWMAHYEEAGQGIKLSNLFGGTPEEKPEQYRISSPITYAEQIQAPLFIYQGRNDPGCPPQQMRHYVERLQQLGKSLEMMWVDSGHGTLDTEQHIATQEHLLHFAARVLNERHAER